MDIQVEQCIHQPNNDKQQQQIQTQYTIHTTHTYTVQQ
jgi:hypothetical protein